MTKSSWAQTGRLVVHSLRVTQTTSLINLSNAAVIHGNHTVKKTMTQKKQPKMYKISTKQKNVKPFNNYNDNYYYYYYYADPQSISVGQL